MLFATLRGFGCGAVIALGDITKEQFPQLLGQLYDEIVVTALKYDELIRRPFPWKEPQHATKFPTLYDLLTAKEEDHPFDSLVEDSRELRTNEAGILEILLMTQSLVNYSMYSFEPEFVRSCYPDRFAEGVKALLEYETRTSDYFYMSPDLILASFEQDSVAFFKERNELLQEWLRGVIRYLRVYVYYQANHCKAAPSN